MAPRKKTPPAQRNENARARDAKDDDASNDDTKDDDADAADIEAPEVLEGTVVAAAALPVPDLPDEIGPLVPARDPVQRFLNEARRYRRLSEDEERTLITLVREHADKAAARKLVVHNLRLVVSIAYQYRQAWTSMMDLFQEGGVGLVEAVKRWDPNVGTRFGSYAAYWIRAYILRFLMTNSRLIHVGNTRAGRKLFFRLERERQKLLAAGIDVTPKLLAAKLDVNEKDLEEVSAHLGSREVSFDPRPDDDGIALEERLPRVQASPEAAAARGELTQNVARLMKRFEADLTDERERAIWREHLAAADDARPLGELGARFGVSKQRMGQIADKLKQRFREAVLTELGSEIELAWQPEEAD
jgi:RNA polymerase sigma-32 factor